jgi:hypothetical protein
MVLIRWVYSDSATHVIPYWSGSLQPQNFIVFLAADRDLYYRAIPENAPKDMLEVPRTPYDSVSVMSSNH